MPAPVERHGRERTRAMHLRRSQVEDEAVGVGRSKSRCRSGAPWAAGRRKRDAGLDQFIKGVQRTDAVALAHCVEDQLSPRDCAGVAPPATLRARCGPLLSIRIGLPSASAFAATAMNAAGRRMPRPADDDLRMRVGDQELEIVGKIEIELVAARHPVPRSPSRAGSPAAPERNVPRIGNTIPRDGHHAAGLRVAEIEQQLSRSDSTPMQLGRRMRKP